MYTGHGHHIPFTFLDEVRPTQIVKCGGPDICPGCTIEALPHLPAFRTMQVVLFPHLKGNTVHVDPSQEVRA